MKRVLIINLGWEQEPLIDVVLNSNCELYGVHYCQEIYRREKFRDVFVTDLRNIADIIKFANKIQPDAVISDQCDYSYFVQAVLCEKYQLSGPRIKQAQVSSNKLIQRQLAQEKNILIPQFAQINSPEEIHQFTSKIGYPIIIKPIDNRGSFGVTKVNRQEDVLPAYLNALSHSHSRLVIAEEFINGVEITIDGYCFQKNPYSLALAKKRHIDNNRQVSVDIKYPGELEDELYTRALRLNEEVISKLGYDFGMTHAEYMVSSSENIYLIEAANRGGGVYTSEVIVPTVSGVDILNAYVQDSIGNNLTNPPQNIKNRQVILKFFSFEPGKIKLIEGITNITKDPSLLKFRLAVQSGDIIAPISNDANRHGFVIVTAEQNVRAKAQELIDQIKVIYA